LESKRPENRWKDLTTIADGEQKDSYPEGNPEERKISVLKGPGGNITTRELIRKDPKDYLRWV